MEVGVDAQARHVSHPTQLPPGPEPLPVFMTDRMSVMRCMAALSVAAAAVVTAMTFAIASPPSPAAATVEAGGATNGVCPTLTASTWQLPYAPYTKGTAYDVKVNGYTCAKADGYIKKLVTSKVGNGIPTTVTGGPKGWTCTASKSKTGARVHGPVLQEVPLHRWDVLRLERGVAERGGSGHSSPERSAPEH